MTTSEVARALRALSSTYVERRARLSGRGAFDSAGKRAAYALYYAPRRFQMTGHVIAQLDPGPGPVHLTDLGCGTGAAGAAWACLAGTGASVVGVDTHPWAVDEARATYRAFRHRRAGAPRVVPPTARGRSWAAARGASGRGRGPWS